MCGNGNCKKRQWFQGKQSQTLLTWDKVSVKRLKTQEKFWVFQNHKSRHLCLLSMSNLHIRSVIKASDISTHWSSGTGNQSPEAGLFEGSELTLGTFPCLSSLTYSLSTSFLMEISVHYFFPAMSKYTTLEGCPLIT